MRLGVAHDVTSAGGMARCRMAQGGQCRAQPKKMMRRRTEPPTALTADRGPSHCTKAEEREAERKSKELSCNLQHRQLAMTLLRLMAAPKLNYLLRTHSPARIESAAQAFSAKVTAAFQ